MIRTVIPGPAVAVLILAAGCDVLESDRFGGHPPVAGVTLYDGAGEEITPVPSFVSSWPDRVEARFHDAAGREIQGLEHRHRVELRWNEPGAVALLPVEDQPFQWDVRVHDPCAERREFVVGYGHIPHADERVFTVPVTITRPVREVRLYGEDGLPHESPLILPPGESFILEVRLFDCTGEEIAQLETSDRIQLYIHPGEEYRLFTPLPTERLSWRVEAPSEAGWQMHLSFGFGRVGEFPPQVFGPFAVGLAEPGPDD
jgi:hypothetical protein